MKIHFCCMTQDELHELAPNIKALLPYVDSVTIVDGGSQGNTTTYMRNWSQEEPKIRYFISLWENNFPKQRNKYLDKVNEIAQHGDWILVHDCDEYIEEESLKNLRQYIQIAEKHDKNMIGFQCRSVSLKGDKRVWESMDNYWKRFLIKWNPNIRYTASGTGTVHESIIGFQQKIWDPGCGGSKQPALVWEHRKQENDIWRKGLRNCLLPGIKVFTYTECKNIEDIKINDIVIDKDGQPRKVTNVAKKYITNQLINRIKLPGSTDILCTDEHKWLTFQGNNCRESGKNYLAFPKKYSNSCKCCESDLDYPDPDFYWDETKNLSRLNIMRFPRISFSQKEREKITQIESCFNTCRIEGGNNYTGTIPKKIYWCPEIAYLTGVWLAKGHLEKSDDNIYDRIGFSLHIKEKETIGKELTEILEDKFQRKSWYEKSREEKDDNGCLLLSQVKGLGKWLETHFRRGSVNKVLPYYFIAGSTHQELKELLRGLFSGDAALGETISLTIASPHLAQGAYLGLIRLGFRPSWHFIPLETLNNKNSGFEHKNPMYRVQLILDEYEKFYKEILNQIPEKKDIELCYSFNKWTSPYSVKSGIISIEKEKYTGYVYDIEVENTHSFLVPGATSHNCFIGGGGPNGMHSHINDWKELRQLCDNLNLKNWHDFYKYLLKGNIDQSIKDWIIKHSQDNWGDGSSEFREAYKTYFRLLHPEEETPDMKNIHIP